MYDKKLMALIGGLILMFLVLLVVFSYFEARTFTKLTGTEVSTFEAIFIQLRVIEPVKPNPRVHFDDRGFATLMFDPFPCEAATKGATYYSTGAKALILCDGHSWEILEDRMYQVKRTDDEVNEVLNKASEGIDSGSKYPGMTFEDGISQFANWLFGHVEDTPFDDE